MSEEVAELAEIEVLELSIAGYQVGVNLEFVEFIQIIYEIVPIPKSPEFVLGISNIENTVVPMIDLDILLGVDDLVADKNSIGILLRNEDKLYGLHTSHLPNVINSVLDKEKTIETEVIPDIWISGTYDEIDGTAKPLLNPKLIWDSLGEVQKILEDNDRIRQIVEENISSENHPEDIPLPETRNTVNDLVEENKEFSDDVEVKDYNDGEPKELDADNDESEDVSEVDTSIEEDTIDSNEENNGKEGENTSEEINENHEKDEDIEGSEQDEKSDQEDLEQESTDIVDENSESSEEDIASEG